MLFFLIFQKIFKFFPFLFFQIFQIFFKFFKFCFFQIFQINTFCLKYVKGLIVTEGDRREPPPLVYLSIYLSIYLLFSYFLPIYQINKQTS